jgi:hypothetical protein
MTILLWPSVTHRFNAEDMTRARVCVLAIAHKNGREPGPSSVLLLVSGSILDGVDNPRPPVRSARP